MHLPKCDVQNKDDYFKMSVQHNLCNWSIVCILP